MNKYLLCCLTVFINYAAYADVTFDTSYGQNIMKISNDTEINLGYIKAQSADKFEISNSTIEVDNFSDWQNWNANVELSNVTLQLNTADGIEDGVKLNHFSDTNTGNVTIKNSSSLYKTYLESYSGDVFLHLQKVTDDYQKVFDDSDPHGKFIESIRDDNPNDKMLDAMDAAENEAQINSIMNSSYHFNPLILTRPIKTINRAEIINLSLNADGIGANVGYMVSDKTNNFSGHLYFGSKYNDFYFNIKINLNKFSYKDSLNEFSGFMYGVNLHAKQYLSNFWLDGLTGLNQTLFDTDGIYQNGNVSRDPKAVSGYARFAIGYDFIKITDFVLSPFAGFVYQKSKIMNMADADSGVLVGGIGKYNFVIDGIKYEYGVSVTSDEKLNWHVGGNIGFASIVDNIGASINIDVFKDEFDDINYKLSTNAKIQF